MQRVHVTSVAGWGNYRPASCALFRPERAGELRESLATVPESGPDSAPNSSLAEKSPAARTRIARGLGRSYGDSATNADAGVILQERMDALMSFDPESGVVEAEGGVSLETLIELFLPRGYFLPVTPGTKFVTLGGAVAADVHGKNNHVDGTIGNFVRGLRLLLADGTVLDCSPSENADAFWATVGGMGLTGVILSVKLQLIRVVSAYLKVQYTRADGLDAALDRFESQQGLSAKYSVAWIDCLAAGASLGRSVVMEGDHAIASDLPEKFRRHPLTPKLRRGKGVPFFFPKFALSRLTVRLFNKAYYARNTDRTKVVDYDSFFYPLDAVRHWNRIYGKRGFVQYQALFPLATARQGLREMLEKIVLSGQASFLAVLKRTGEQGQGMLSFPFPGYTLALDFPNAGDKLTALLKELDQILLRHHGRLYLAKDATMSGEMFKAMYPRVGEFEAVKARLDPQGKFSSTQSRRVGLTPQ